MVLLNYLKNLSLILLMNLIKKHSPFAVGADAGSGSVSGHNVSIDFSHLTPGAYVLNLRGAEGVYNHIIIKR